MCQDGFLALTPGFRRKDQHILCPPSEPDAFDDEFFGQFPIRQELTVLPADLPWKTPIGFAMHETVGVASYNTRGVTRMTIQRDVNFTILSRPIPGAGRFSLAAVYRPLTEDVLIQIDWPKDSLGGVRVTELGLLSESGSFEIMSKTVEDPGRLTSVLLPAGELARLCYGSIRARDRDLELPALDEVFDDDFWPGFLDEAMGLRDAARVMAT